MKENKSVWYIPSEDGQPSGPYNTEQILERFRNRQVTKTTLCWREGMTDWLPFGKVEPFAAEVKRAKSAARRRHIKIAICIVAIACTIAGGLIAYRVVMGPAVVRKAKKLMAVGLYNEAAQQLDPYVKKKPLDSRAAYLLALANINHYATKEQSSSSNFWAGRTRQNPLNRAKELFLRAFAVNAKWISKAKTDLAEASSRIPSTAGSLSRALAISQLRAELQLADTKQLAKDLLERARAQHATMGRAALDETLIFQITNWDPSLANQVVSLALSEGNLSPSELLKAEWVFKQWIRKKPSLEKFVPTTLLQYADEYIAQGKYEHTEAALEVITRLSPNFSAEVAQRRKQYLTKCLEIGEAANVVKILDRKSSESPEMKAAAANLYLQAARQLRQIELFLAQKALEKALKLNPNVATNEEDTFLSIQLTPKPNETKLIRCQVFLRNYPNSPHQADVLMTIVSDASSFFDQQGRWRRNTALPHLQAGFEAAKNLIQQYPKTDNLDLKVFELTKRLVENKQLKEVLSLTSDLLAAVPDSVIKLQIEHACSQWRQQLDRGTRTDKVGPSTPNPNLPQPTVIKTAVELEKFLADAINQNVMWLQLTRKDVNSENLEKLQGWVKKGGVLWVETDIAKLFGFVGLSKIQPGSLLGKAQVANVNHPIVSGLSGATVSCEVRPSSSVITGMPGKISQSMTPLLVQQYRRNLVTVFCAVRNIGKGIVILRPARIQTTSLRGRRFEQNLRTFSFNSSTNEVPRLSPRRGRSSPRFP